MNGLIWLENEKQHHVLQTEEKRMELHKKGSWDKSKLRRSAILNIGINLQMEGLKKYLISACFDRIGKQFNLYSHMIRS